jgi:hypothetical protein
MKILTHEERKKERRGIKALILGEAGVGKTSLLKTLPPESKPLFIDLEAGDLSVADWQGDSIRLKTWEDCRDLAVLVGGANPNLAPHQPYSEAHYNAAVKKHGKEFLEGYNCLFIDSLTVAARFCFTWAKKQPECMSEKTGKPDIRGAYGLLGQEIIGFITQIQHARLVDTFFVGILERRTDDSGVVTWGLQVDGSKIALESPGIVDLVLSMRFKDAEKTERVFIARANEKGFPAKDRSGKLDMVEPASLAHIMAKINM